MVFRDDSGKRKWYVLVCTSVSVVFVILFFIATILYAVRIGGESKVAHSSFVLNDSANAAAYEKVISLTFDDGPHPIYTPKLIEVLKKENVPATFFMLGVNVLAHPDVARAVADAGFEIGNHTFSHSQDIHTSRKRLELELITTDRILRSVTGGTTRLYRPPYFNDMDIGRVDGNAVNEMPMWWAKSIGFTVVGADIDSRDWAQNGKADAKERILKNLIAHTKKGKHVVIMHDGGARGAAIEALEEFIPAMKKEGYTFVPVSYFFSGSGVVHTKDNFTVMDSALVLAARMFTLAQYAVGLMIGGIVLLSVTRLVIIVLARSVYWRRYLLRLRGHAHKESVTVLIPAYNEEANIEATVRSVLKSSMSPLEVIVIDDGSSDNTSLIVERLREEYGEVLVLLRKANGGSKAGALSYAISHARGNILVCIDGDTIINEYALECLTRHFGEREVGAVAGKVYPARVETILGIFQYLEYVQSQNMDKPVFALGNAVSVVPGAIGAWRKSAVQEVGGFTSDTLVEDQDLTMALLAHGWRVEYDQDAHAYSETPATVRTFFRQRFRWVFGTIQCFWKYKKWICSPRARSLGFIVLPHNFLFYIALPLLVLVLDFAVLSALLGVGDIDTARVLGPFIVFAIFDFAYAALGLLSEKKFPLERMLFLIPQRIFYRYIIALVLIKSIYIAIAGGVVKWGVQQRCGHSFALWRSINMPQVVSSLRA